MLVHARKPSLLPDDAKFRRRHLVEEAVVMASALTVHDALRRFLAHRHRQGALAGRGPVANALLRRPPPRPQTYYLLRPGLGPNLSAEIPLQDEGLEEIEDLEIWESAPAGLTMSADYVAGESNTNYLEGGIASRSGMPQKQSPWALGGPAMPALSEEPDAAAFRTVGGMEALDLANRQPQTSALRRKPNQRPKYAAAAAVPGQGE